MEEVVRDDEDPDAEGAVSRVAPALHAPGPIALMITQPAAICKTDAGRDNSTGPVQ